MASKKNPDRPTPPANLSPRALQLWRDLTDEYEFAPADIALLRECCAALDRADEAAAILRRDGLVAPDRYGSPKVHPLCDIEARSRALFARLLAQLRVNGAPVAGARRGRPGFTQTPDKGDPRRRPTESVPAVLPLPPRQRVRLTGGPR